MKITELKYGIEADGYPFFTLRVNGHEAMMGADSLNSIAHGYILIDGVGLPETIIELPGVTLEGQYTNDPVLLRISRQFLDDINARAIPFNTILGRRPIPPSA
jgi:hypothetical protein